MQCRSPPITLLRVLRIVCVQLFVTLWYLKIEAIGFEAIAYQRVVNYFSTVSCYSETSMGTGLDKSIRFLFSLNLRLVLVSLQLGCRNVRIIAYSRPVTLYSAIFS